MQLLALDRRQEQLIANALGHERVGQVEPVKLRLYGQSVCYACMVRVALARTSSLGRTYTVISVSAWRLT